MTSVLVIGDVGAARAVRHVGDEAMTQAAIRELRARGDYQLTVVSSLPEDTAALYGVGSVRRPGTPRGSDESRRTRREALESAALRSSLLPGTDPAWDFVRALDAADAVLVAGGGNLTSLWPSFMDERLVAARVARAAGKPVVITGQTIGPALSGHDRELVRELLAQADVVGLREQTSFDLAASLMTSPATLRRTVDDASFLPGTPVGEFPDGVSSTRPYVLATFQYANESQAFLKSIPHIARLLDAIARRCEADVVFVPHLGAIGLVTGHDSDAHQAITSHLASPYRILPVQSNEVSIALARDAVASVSNRYHPAVFASANGRPAITISHDDYTEAKFTGVLRNFGVADLSLPIFAVSSLDVADWAAEVVKAWERDEDLIGQRRAENQKWWDEVHARLSRAPVSEFAALDSARWIPADQRELIPPELRERVTRWRAALPSGGTPPTPPYLVLKAVRFVRRLLRRA